MWRLSFLRRATGRIGLYIGLTGTRIGHGDMISSGLMDFFIRHEDLPAFETAIIAMSDQDDIDDILASLPDMMLPIDLCRIWTGLMIYCPMTGLKISVTLLPSLIMCWHPSSGADTALSVI